MMVRYQVSFIYLFEQFRRQLFLLSLFFFYRWGIGGIERLSSFWGVIQYVSSVVGRVGFLVLEYCFFCFFRSFWKFSNLINFLDIFRFGRFFYVEMVGFILVWVNCFYVRRNYSSGFRGFSGWTWQRSSLRFSEVGFVISGRFLSRDAFRRFYQQKVGNIVYCFLGSVAAGLAVSLACNLGRIVGGVLCFMESFVVVVLDF